jgi:NAD+ synthase
MPYMEMDLFWYGLENKFSAEEVGRVMDKSEAEVNFIFSNLTRKKKTTEYLRLAPITYKL